MKRYPGFSLIELIVAIGIMTLITTAVVANLRGRSPARQLNDQARNVASLIRQAQVQATAGEPVDGTVPIGGYGVHVAACGAPPCQVELFADKNGNFTLDAGELMQTLDLGGVVTVTSVSVANPLYIMFKPPSGFVCFNNSCSGSETAVITLGVTGATDTATVSVQQLSGQVTTS